MPKELFKIDKFEGGINTQSDRRDLEENQATRIVDGKVYTSGKIEMAGGVVPFINEIDKIMIREPGWGLFTFLSDYDAVDDMGRLKGGEYLHPTGYNGVPESDQDLVGGRSLEYFMKLFDPESSANTESVLPGFLVREEENEVWTQLTETLKMYSNEEFIKAPIKPHVEIINGAVRIADTTFEQYGMYTNWFGVIRGDRYINKDHVNNNFIGGGGVDGESVDKTPPWTNINTWLYTHADCKPPRTMWGNFQEGEVDESWVDSEFIATLSDTIQEWSGSDVETFRITLEDPLAGVAVGDIIVIHDTGTLGELDEYMLVLDTVVTGDPAIYVDVDCQRGLFGTDAGYHSGSTDNGYYENKIYIVQSTQDSLTGGWGYKWGHGIFNGKATWSSSPGQIYGSDFTHEDVYDDHNSRATPPSDIRVHVDVDLQDDESWGVASDGFTGFWSEYDGVQFMYQFVEQDNDAVVGWLPDHYYKFWASFVYDGAPGTLGSQESPLQKCGAPMQSTLKEKCSLYAALTVKWTGINNDGTHNSNTAGRPDSSDQEIGTAARETTVTDPALIEELKGLYINPRITGVRIYVSSSEDQHNAKVRLLDASFGAGGGIKTEGMEEYNPWCPIFYGLQNETDLSGDDDGWEWDDGEEQEYLRQRAAYSHYRVSARGQKFRDVNNPHSFNLLRPKLGEGDQAFYFESFPAGEDGSGSIYELPDGEHSVLYKTSVEYEGYRYVGNVAYPHGRGITGEGYWDSDEFYAGEDFNKFFKGKVYGDRMIRCHSNMPDVLPPENFVDVAINDGEEITHLDTFGGKLLQFKENTLYILGFNEQQGEYLHETLKHRGVTRSYHVVQTAVGICWMNKYGVYMYNGDEHIDITQNKLDIQNTWNWSDNKSIGYDPVERSIIIMNDITDSNISSGFVFNIDTGAWTQLSDKFQQAGYKSNFVNNREGNLVFSSFNATTIDASVNGLQFIQESGGLHEGRSIIRAAATTPVDGDGNAFDWNNFVNIAENPIISIRNSQLTSAEVSDNGLKFHSFSIPVNTINTIEFYGGITSHIHTGDWLYFTDPDLGVEDDNRMYWRDADGTLNHILNMIGPWEVIKTERFYPETSPPIPDEDIVGGPGDDDDDVSVGDKANIVPDVDDILGGQGHQEIRPIVEDILGVTGDDIELFTTEDDDEIVTDKWPNKFTLRKSTEGMYYNDDLSFEGGTPQTNATYGILDSSGNATLRAWNTITSSRRNGLDIRGCNIPDNMFFDGVYKVLDIISATEIKIDNNYGEGRIGLNNSNYDNPVLFKFFRLMQNEADPTQGSRTVFDYANGHTLTKEFINLTNMVMWDRNSVDSSHFDFITKDYDFAEPGLRKRIYRVHITYTAKYTPISMLPRIRVVAIVTTKDGVFTLFPNIDKSVNYGRVEDMMGGSEDLGLGLGNNSQTIIETLASTSGGANPITQDNCQTATIEFNDPDKRLNNVLSFQLRFLNSAQHIGNITEDILTNTSDLFPTSANFEINDINIVLRKKNVK